MLLRLSLRWAGDRSQGPTFKLTFLVCCFHFSEVLSDSVIVPGTKASQSAKKKLKMDTVTGPYRVCLLDQRQQLTPKSK